MSRNLIRRQPAILAASKPDTHDASDLIRGNDKRLQHTAFVRSRLTAHTTVQLFSARSDHLGELLDRFEVPSRAVLDDGVRA